MGDVVIKSEFASIIGNTMTPENITLEQALELLGFPKKIGMYKDGEVMINSGRYGHYITLNGKNYALPKDTSPFTLTMDDAKVIIDEKDKKIIKEFKGFSVRNGPYGPYIFKDRKFIAIPKGLKPEELTHKQCLEIIKKGGSKRVQRGKRYRKYIKK
jgi:DNA topoisomerase-1